MGEGVGFRFVLRVIAAKNSRINPRRLSHDFKDDEGLAEFAADVEISPHGQEVFLGSNNICNCISTSVTDKI